MTDRLAETGRIFLRLGLTAFGGPAAHIAIFQRELVEVRGWVTRERFLDMLGASSLLPGPTSTELAMGIGFERARWAGLVVAGTCFILPASLIVLALAILYESTGSLPAVSALLYGTAPVVIAIVAHAVTRLAPGALREPATWLVGAAAVALTLLGADPLPVLVGGALVLVSLRRGPELLREVRGQLALVPWSAAPGALGGTTEVAVGLGLVPILLLFLKLGLVVFGSGYVLLAFLRTELVAPGFLTEQQLLDAIAIGQVTPGPVFTSATFIGYLLAGLPGAIVASVGIFLPSFVLVGIVHPFLDRIRRSPLASAAIDGLNAAAVGLIAATLALLVRDAVVDALTLAIAVVALAALVAGRAGPVSLLLTGSLVGLVSSMAGPA